MLLINLPFSLVPPFTKKSGIFHFWTIDTAFVTLFFYCEHSFSYLLFDFCNDSDYIFQAILKIFSFL